MVSSPRTNREVKEPNLNLSNNLVEMEKTGKKSFNGHIPEKFLRGFSPHKIKIHIKGIMSTENK